jgi:hypothetical protein
MISLEEFRGYLKIDRNKLDRELVQQPRLFEQVGESMAEAIGERDTLKEQLATIDANLDIEYRRTFIESKVKFTEPTVAAAVQTDPRHMKAAKAYLESKANAEKVWALRDAFTQRASMLEYLCKLTLSSYYQPDSVKDSARDHLEYEMHRKRRETGRP